MCDGRVARRRPGRRRAPCISVQRSGPAVVRIGARHAQRPLSVGRVRRAPAAHRVGPGGGHSPRPGRRAAPGRHQCGHDPRPRPLHGQPARGRTPRRRARRGDGLREPRGRDLRAWRLHVADRRDHSLAGAGDARPRRARQDRVLEGRRSQPARGAGARVGQDGPRASGTSASGRRATPARARGFRRPRDQEPAHLSR